MREIFFPLSVSRWSQTVLVCSFCSVFAACAVGQSGQQRSAGPPAAVSAQPAETAPVVYYAGVDQLVVYSEPRSSASSLTHLLLYQKVYRYKMEKGYASIKVEESGVTGWAVRAEVVGPRVPSPAEVRTLETTLQKLAGQPVTVSLWVRTEVVVTGQRYSSVKEQAEAASSKNTRAAVSPAPETPTATQPSKRV